MSNLTFLRRSSYYIILDYTNLSTVNVKMPLCNSDSLSQHFECQRSYFSKVPKQTNQSVQKFIRNKKNTNPCTECWYNIPTAKVKLVQIFSDNIYSENSQFPGRLPQTHTPYPLNTIAKTQLKSQNSSLLRLNLSFLP